MSEIEIRTRDAHFASHSCQVKEVGCYAIHEFSTHESKHPMTSVTNIAQAMQEVLTDRADELARDTEFIKRQPNMTGSGFVQALVFGWQRVKLAWKH